MPESDSGEEIGLLPFDDGTFGRTVRQQWHDGRWFFSVVDAVAILTDSDRPRKYWADLKARLADEGAGQLSAKIGQLKMRALDGKLRATDAADTETMLRIVQSIPSPKAEPFKQWLATVGAQKLADVAAELPEGQRRLLIRGILSETNGRLNDAAQRAGVLSGRDFALFHDAGYQGLYHETARDIATRKGLTRGQAVQDWMGSDELSYNLFRASLTDQRLRRDEVDTKAAANRAHFETGAAVRAFILEQGATLPEELPTPAQSIQQLEAAEAQRAQDKLQPRLFPEDTDGSGGEDT